jgi:hypothetical protein
MGVPFVEEVAWVCWLNFFTLLSFEVCLFSLVYVRTACLFLLSNGWRCSPFVQLAPGIFKLVLGKSMTLYRSDSICRMWTQYTYQMIPKNLTFKILISWNQGKISELRRHLLPNIVWYFDMVCHTTSHVFLSGS